MHVTWHLVTFHSIFTQGHSWLSCIYFFQWKYVGSIFQISVLVFWSACLQLVENPPPTSVLLLFWASIHKLKKISPLFLLNLVFCPILVSIVRLSTNSSSDELIFVLLKETSLWSMTASALWSAFTPTKV